MHPIRFDQLAKALARRRSRRQAVVHLGSAALAGVLGIGRGSGASLAQTVTPATTTPGTRPVFPPIPVSQTFAPLFPAPDLYPIVGFDEDEIIPILGPPVGVEHQPEFALPEEFPDIVAVTDGGVVPIVDFDPDLISAPPSTPAAVAATDTTEEAACGLNNSQDVEFYPGSHDVSQEFVAAHWPPVGNIQWNTNLHARFPGEGGNVNGLRWCSGTLIDDVHFLTAGHCFQPDFGGWITPSVNGVKIDRREIARNMRVNFNFQWGPEGERPVTTVAIVELVEDGLKGLDYAIVRLEQNPGPPFRPPARIALNDAPQGSVLCMMGHPSMLPKRVANGHASEYAGPHCYYDDLDTAGGASGAGLLSPATGLLVGIHTNGGCDDPAKGNNHGLRIESLLDASPRLRSLAGR